MSTDQSLPPTLEFSDPFERLHDSVVIHILNRVGDIRDLGRCSAVSKRFFLLVSLVENVTVQVDCVIASKESSLNVEGRGVFGHLVRFVVGSIVRPLQVLQHMLGPKKAMLAEVSHHSPGEVLRNFKTIRNLRVVLPAGELGVEDGLLLKWKAEFSSTLDSCIILGASAVVKPEIQKNGNEFKFENQRTWEEAVADGEGEGQDDGSVLPESLFTDGGLKLRVVWTISSLIAASGRHYFLRQIISEHSTLAGLVLTDADGQGLLCMDKDQLEEFRKKPLAASASANRTQVPALNMKLWYAPHLELPGGTGLRGATLVAIRPRDQPRCKDVDCLVSSAFEEPFKTAASLLVKRRTYLLEMNSF